MACELIGDTEPINLNVIGSRLATLLESSAPSGVHVRYVNGRLCYYYEFSGAYGGSDDPSKPSVIDDWLSRFNVVASQSPESLRIICEVVLDHFQDFVSEMTAMPWPGVHTQPKARAQLDSNGLLDLLFLESDGSAHIVGRLALDR